MSDDSVAPDAEDAGAAAPAGDVPNRISRRLGGSVGAAVALIWIAFTLYVQTDLAILLDGRFGTLLSEATGGHLSFVPSAAQANLAHLLFALVLASLVFPRSQGGERARVRPRDLFTIFIVLALAGYLLLYRAGFGEDGTVPPGAHWAAGATGVVILCLAVRRTIGTALFLVSAASVLIALFGMDVVSPDPTAPPGDALLHPLQIYWIGTKGVFGRPLDTAMALVVPLVLFGTIWLQAGAGVYIGKLAASVLGARGGGAGKSAVVASAVSGCYAPSARIASDLGLAADGVLMERTGFPRASAQVIVRACSSHAQIAPPVMAGAIVLIAEQTGLSVGRVVLHAILPAAVAYIALYLFVHIKAARSQVGGLPAQPIVPNKVRNTAGLVGWVLLTCVLVAAVAFVQGWISTNAPGAAMPVTIATWAGLYIALLWSASRRPDLKPDAPDAPVAELAPLGAALAGGLYLLMPLFFLVLQLVGAQRPAGPTILSCAALAAGIVLTHHPVKALFRGQFAFLPTAAWRGVADLFAAAVQAARIMAIVVVAAAAAGLVLASLSLTGLDELLVTAAEKLGAYHFSLALFLAAASALFFATGMPTAIGYLVVSVLVIPALAAGGGAAPAIVLHLFALYFAVFASAPLPRLVAAPMLLLPFAFYVNPELVLVGVSPMRVPVVAATAVLGAVAMASALYRHLLVPNRMWETATLALAAIGLLCPALFITGPMRDLVYIPALVLMGSVWLIQLRRQF